MKHKWMWLTAIILLVTFPITACSSGNRDADNDQSEYEIIESEEVAKSTGNLITNSPVSKDKIDNLTTYTEAWTELYSVHEATINAYEGMPIISLVDRILTEGSFDASKGYFIMDDLTMRNDQVILRTKTEFIRSEDGAFVCLYQVARDMEQSGNANKFNLLTFIFMSETQYEFVNAEGTIGVDGKILKLTEGMTVEEATQLFLDSGYTISETGGIEDGVFVVK